VGFEFLSAPFPLGAPQVPGGYQYLVEHGCAGPILELPVDAGSPDQKARLYFQALHGCPISGGYLSRGGNDTALTRAWRQVARRDEPDAEPARRLGADIRAAGFRHVVLWKPAYESRVERARDLRLAQALFPEPPVFEDDESAVYALADSKFQVPGSKSGG